MTTTSATATPDTGRTGTIRVLVTDDHPVVRQGLCAIIDAQPHMAVAGEAEDGVGMLERFDELNPDVVVLDIRMPNLEGVPALDRLIAKHPDARVLIMTTYDGEEDVFRALAKGAKGYILKDARFEQIVEAIERIHKGESFLSGMAANRVAQRIAKPALTERETEVMHLAAEGLRNREIADRIHRTEDTVKMHLKSVFEKLDVSTRVEAVREARRRGLVR
jgi:two-component system, NarL family, response regulator